MYPEREAQGRVQQAREHDEIGLVCVGLRAIAVFRETKYGTALTASYVKELVFNFVFMPSSLVPTHPTPNL